MNYSISCSPKKVSVVVRGPFNFALFVFVPIWVALWVFMIPKAFHGVQPQSIVGIIFFGIVASLFVYLWLWNLGGREELEFTINGLTFNRVLFGVPYSRVFRMSKISNPHFENSRRNGKSRTPSGIGFSYGGSEVRIGDHLTQRAAKGIVAAVLQEIPELRKSWGCYVEGLPEESEDLSLRLT
jgi:energy-coupling factor transporter transmembrane protein EcfT